jgi:2-deoxy-D-gluconate 3-dehydrogenase
VLPEFGLEGQVALVTGGNRGIGRGIALAMGRSGATVVIAARDEAKNTAVVAELRALGAVASSVRCDVRSRSDLRLAVDHCVESHSALSILVNNAGVSRPALPENLSEDDWDTVIDTNLKSVFLLSQMAHGLMRERGGKIINIGSMYSLVGGVNTVAYAASKGGVVQLTKSLASAWAKDNIQVNAILPGVIRSEVWGQTLDNAETVAKIESRTPATRIAEGEEMGPICVFLASRAADFITGQAIAIDGGLSTADFLTDFVSLRRSAERKRRRGRAV